MQHVTIGVAVVLVLMVQAAPGQGPPLFPLEMIPLQGQLPPVFTALTQRAHFVDGDGDQDAIVLCVTNVGVTQLRTYFNDGSGGFGAPPLVRPLSASFTSLKSVRLNNDSSPDLLLRNGASLTFLFGTGGGNYGPEVPFPVSGISGAAWIDDDGDGDDDIHFLGNPTPAGATLQVMRNDGTGSFAPPVAEASVAPGVGTVSIKDVNGDGFLDAVVYGTFFNAAASYTESRVQVAFGNPTGTFTPGPLQILATIGAASGPILTDVDGDGDLDLVAYAPQSSQVGTFLMLARNQGNGTFGPASIIEIQQGLNWWSVDAGDVDADGKSDIGVFVDGSVILFKGNASGLAGGPKTVDIGGTGGNLFQVADLNRDGRPDVVAVVGTAASTTLSVLLDVDSSPAPQSIPIGTAVQGLATGDWNKDGIPDLVVASPSPVQGLRLFFGTGGGAFLPPSFIPLGTNPLGVLTADVNGDGMDDLVVRDTQVRVLLGNGAGGFGPPIVTPACGTTCNGIDGVVVADLNSDGIPDLFVSHPFFGFAGPSTDVFLGNGNGTFQLFNTLPMFSGLNTRFGDVNGDGILDMVQSVAFFLSVSLGLGNGTFSGSSVTFISGPANVGSFGGDLALGDVNGDGMIDAVLAGGAVALNNGAGGLSAALYHAVPYAAGVALADVDTNLQTDAIIFQPGLHRVSIQRNLTPTTGTGFAYGLGCPGTSGIVPRLSAFGLPQPGATVTLVVDRALGQAPGWLFTSPAPALIPVGFGCTLFVDPLALGIIPLQLSGPAGPGRGRLSIPVALPIGPPIAAAAEIVIADPASPFGFSGSNGMYFVIQ